VLALLTGRSAGALLRRSSGTGTSFNLVHKGWRAA
jgi:hypothetical protein